MFKQKFSAPHYKTTSGLISLGLIFLLIEFFDEFHYGIQSASLLLSVFMITGLIADLVLIPLLESFPGRTIVRFSAILATIIYPTWLLVPWLPARIVLLVIIRLTTTGWYRVLQGEAYSSIPGKSGTVMSISSLAGFAGGALIWLVGWVAGQVGLNAAMWLLLLGPISLLLFVPAERRKELNFQMQADT